MLIGISGKIGSGKDTVAQAILWHMYNQEMRPSPYSFQQMLNKPNQRLCGWEIRNYAGKVKEIASILTGIPAEEMSKQEVKSQELGSEWVKDGKTMTLRNLLQLIGTEAGRKIWHPNVWVNALFADYRPQLNEESLKKIVKNVFYNEPYGNSIYPNWIITDVRFPNELHAIRDRKGILIRVERPTELRYPELWEYFQAQDTYDEWDTFLKYIGKYEQVYHPSETSLDNAGEAFHYTIENDGSLGRLLGKVEAILEMENII